MADAGKDTGPDGAIEQVTQVQLALMRARAPDRRGQHFKTNGCVDALFEVHAQLPPQYRVGLFAEPATYRSVIRYSNGAEADDRQRDVHGMAIKLFDVPGQLALDDPNQVRDQDFILADFPVFFIRTASDYALFMRDVVESAKQGRPPEKFIAHLQQTHPEDVEVFMRFLRKQLQQNPLTSTYWSQVPYAFGQQQGSVARYRARPVDAPDASSDLGEGPDYLRERMVARLSEGADEVVFDFDIQLKSDADQTVIDNPTVEWHEPFVTVASLRIAAQQFDSEERDHYGELLTYNPWNALQDHRPVGEVNEVRKQVYVASQTQRYGEQAGA